MSSPHPRRAPRLVLLSVALLSILVAACGSDSNAADKTPTSAGPATTDAGDAEIDLAGVTLRVGDTNNLMGPVLKASGALDDLPYEISWSVFPSGPALLEALNADAVDIGLIGDTPLLGAGAAGSPVVAINAISGTQGTDHFGAIVVRKDSDITSVADLKGKKVAFGRGTVHHYLLVRALEDAGLSLEDVEQVHLPPADAATPFLNGDIDALVTGSFLLANLINTEDPRILVTDAKISSVDGEPLARPVQFVAARNGVLDDPKLTAATEDYILRLQRANAWAKDNPDEWAQEWASFLGLPVESAALSNSFYAPGAIEIDDDLVAELQRRADIFFKAGVLPNTVDPSKVLDPRFNEAVRAEVG